MYASGDKIIIRHCLGAMTCMGDNHSKTLPFSEASAATTEMIKRRASIVWFVLVYCKRRPVGQLLYLYTIVLDKVLTLNVMLYIITREEPC
jgi:hypothetical protein